MPANLSASVEARLKNIAHDRGEAFQFVLNRYARERLLYRLSRSEHAARFVLKGATLFQVWTDRPYRPTLDVDLLGYGPNDLDELISTFRAVCTTPVDDDGLTFLPGSVRGERIREAQEYEGIRLKLLAKLGPAHVDLQIDVGFGDAVTPEAPHEGFLRRILHGADVRFRRGHSVSGSPHYIRPQRCPASHR